MKELPEGWVEVLADEVGDLICGQSPTAATVNSEGIGTPYVTGPEQWTGRDIEKNKWTTEPKRFAPDRSIFITVKGAGVGKTFPGTFCAIGRDVYAFKPSDELSFPFVINAIRSNIAEIVRNARGDIPGLSKDHILSHKIAIPPRAEQRRIVEKVDSLRGRTTRARDELASIPRLIDRYKQAVLTKAFRGDLTADWRARQAPAHVQGNRDGIDSGLGPLPSLPTEWGWVSIGRVCDVGGGLTKNQKRNKLPEIVRYLRVGNVYANELRLDDVREIGCTAAERAEKALCPGDILVVEGNGSIDQIGRVAIWRGEIEGCLHQNHLIRVRVGSEVHDEYVLYWLLSPQGRKYIEAVASTSSGLHTLSLTKVKGLPLPQCSLVEMIEIVQRVKEAYSWINRIVQEQGAANALLDTLDQAILAKAFRGALVPQDPTDEPASVLLERIRAERAGQPKPKRGRRKKEATA